MGKYVNQYTSFAINDFLNKVLETKNFTYHIYSDTDSVVGSSIIEVNGNKIKIEDYFNSVQGNFIKKDDFNEDYVKVCKGDYTPSVTNDLTIKQGEIKYVMKHKVKKRMFKIKVRDKEVIVTEDHSIMVVRENKLISVKATEIIKGDEIILK
jgi:intein/homing endonuclease